MLMIKNSRMQTGSAHVIIVIILVVALLGALGFIFWQNFIDKPDDTSSANAEISKTEDVERKVTIHPRDQFGETGGDSFNLTLPEGWSVENVYEEDDIVKTTDDGKQYLISSAVTNAEWPLMETNQVSDGEIIKTVKTSKGTEVSIIKTSSSLVLSTCQPTGNDCYLDLNGKPLYIHLYWNKPGAQNAVEIDYSIESVKEIIADFETIAKSLEL